MITYTKQWAGIHLLLRLYGSALPRSFFWSFFSGALTVLFWFVPERNGEYWKRSFDHPYAYQVLAFIIGFVVVFRSNLSYQRWWDAVTQVQQMTGRLTEAMVSALVFERNTVDATREEHIQVIDLCIHYASLMHALALQQLRNDYKLSNLSTHTPRLPPPPYDSKGVKGYHVPRLQILSLKRSREQLERYYTSLPLPVIPLDASSLYGGNPVLTDTSPLAGWELEALHQSAKIYDVTASTYSGLDVADKQRPLRERSFFTRLGLLMDEVTGVEVDGGTERVNRVHFWLYTLLSERSMRWKNAPPTTAIVFQNIGHAMAAFEQSLKVATTPFPYPWSQMVAFLLLFFSVSNPLMFLAYVNRLWLAIVLSAFASLTYWSVNEVARDVEDPFCYDPNDIPVARIQWEFNKKLLAAAEAALDVIS